MPIESWNKDEIKKLALVSGKPLEVQCAEAFMNAGWQVRLGTYYHDFSSDRVRELDILIEKDETFVSNSQSWRIRVRILGSCKGFPAEQGPVTYSLSNPASPIGHSVHKPMFFYYTRGPFGTGIGRPLGKQGAEVLLAKLPFRMTRQIVGFDIFQCKESLKTPGFPEYSRKTDRDLYEGLDSALKAAVFFDKADRQKFKGIIVGEGYAVLNIPLLITSIPFWDVSIDGGKPGDPELRFSGYHVGLYPSSDEAQQPFQIMSILWALPRIHDLPVLLDSLLEYCFDEAKLLVG